MAADDRIANAIIEYWYTRLRLHVALLFVLCAAPRVSCTRVSPAAQVFSNDTAFKGTNSDCEGYIFAAEFLQRRVGDGVCDFSNSHSLAELLQLDPSKVRTKYLAASKWSQAFCVFGQKARGGGVNRRPWAIASLYTGSGVIYISLNIVGIICNVANLIYSRVGMLL